MKNHQEGAKKPGTLRTPEEASLVNIQRKAKQEIAEYQAISALHKIGKLDSWQKICHAFLSGFSEKDFVKRRLARDPVALDFTEVDSPGLQKASKDSIANADRCCALWTEKGIEVVYLQTATVGDFRKLASMLTKELCTS